VYADKINRKEIKPPPSSIITIYIILSILSPIRGGDYRGIYDTGFKRGFMGYIGLLLNAPYKIDSMVWMRCG
jgi:hypothetical protein